MDIELRAVTLIQDMVGRCNSLQALIDSNDRTPLTDGSIDVYGPVGKTKRDWRGRVPVQVKGRSSTRKRKTPPSFSVERTELEAHQRNGGVLYFYVDIDTKSGHRTPYYSVLTPFVIQHLLHKMADGQKSVAIPLKELPHAPVQIESIVEVALKGKSQQPSLGVDPVLFERMQSITVFSTETLNLDAPLRLRPGETDFALEMTTTSGASVPLSGELVIMPQDYMEQGRDLTITAGDATYKRVTLRRIDVDAVEIKLDEGLSLTLRDAPGQQQVNINITMQSNFAVRKRALEFITGLADHSQIEVKGHVLRLGEMTEDKTPHMQERREHLAFLRRLQKLFDMLGVDGHYLDLDDLNDWHMENLRVLYHVLVEGAPPGNTSGQPARVLVEFGRWAVMLLVVRGESADAWRYVDPFDPMAPQMFRLSAEDDPTDAVPATAYDVVEAEHFPKILNLRLESIVGAYEAIAGSDRTTGLANLRVLDLISAADICVPRREEFLRGADLLNEWIICMEGEQPLHLINRWQIRWRIRALTDRDRSAIRALKHDMALARDERADEFELACALLLGDTEDAAYLAAKLPDEQRQKMEGWPIWRLRDGADDVRGELSVPMERQLES